MNFQDVISNSYTEREKLAAEAIADALAEQGINIDELSNEQMDQVLQQVASAQGEDPAAGEPAGEEDFEIPPDVIQRIQADPALMAMAEQDPEGLINLLKEHGAIQPKAAPAQAAPAAPAAQAAPADQEKSAALHAEADAFGRVACHSFLDELNKTAAVARFQAELAERQKMASAGSGRAKLAAKLAQITK